MPNSITIACSKENLGSIRSFIERALVSHGISELDIHKLVLAVDEVCANLIIHANNCNPHEFLELHVDVTLHDITFVIKDKGVGFDIAKYQEPDMHDIVSSKRKGGLGLMLVKRIMDKIEFSTEKNHNICRLVKNR